MTKLELEIGGMSCGHCVGAVTKTLAGIRGVEVEQVTIGAAAVRIEPTETSVNEIAAAMAQQGYPVLASR
jgi:copper chaperone CopZ